MTIRAVDLHPLADKELRSAYRWYARYSSTAAQRFQAAVHDVIKRIATAAEQGSPYGQFYRWKRLRRFQYIVYYEIRDPAPVLIYAVAHARRRLGYWNRRTRS